MSYSASSEFKRAIGNTSQLRNLLTIAHPQTETIYGVIGRMEILVDYFYRNPHLHSFIPFLKTYYYVTKACADKYVQKKHFFTNISDNEQLDVYFASLYFKPLLLYLETGESSIPWQTYFDYCRKPHGIPFLQVLLGINAHINTDLYSAIYTLKYHHQKDFFLVSDILQEVIPEVMRYLCTEEKDIFGLGGVLMRDFIIDEFHVVIDRWRAEVWYNVQFTTKKNQKQTFSYISLRTEQMGEQLIQDFTDLRHLHKIKSVLNEINTLKV